MSRTAILSLSEKSVQLSAFNGAQMKHVFLAALAVSGLVAACGTSASDRDVALEATTTGTTVTTTTTTTSSAARPGALAPAPASAPASAAAARPFADRTVTIPSGTALQLSLNTAVASDTSRVEDAVSAELTSPIVIGGRTVVPAGAVVAGIVTAADDSGRVKGRARVALDFTSMTTRGSRYPLSADIVARLASATKSEDATKIGIGAGAGAVIGGILGGKKGAAEGAAVGGGAGTGVVLATKGREVRLTPGTDVSTQLSAPLTVRVAN